MDGIADVLADALKVHGATVERDVVLEGRSGVVLTVPLLVSHEGRSLLCWPGAAPDDVEVLCGDLGADGTLEIQWDGPPRDGPRAVWDRERVARLLGDALLAECGLPLPPLLPDVPAPTRTELPQEPGASPGLPPDVAPPFDLAAPFDAPSGDPAPPFDVPPMDLAPPFEPARSSEPATNASGLDHLLPDAFQDGPMDPWDLDAPEPESEARRLPVRITPRAAQQSVQDRLQADDYRLVLEPIHLFDAEVETFRKGSLDSVREHVRIQVHAVHRSVEVVDPAAVDPGARDLLPPTHAVPAQERPVRIQAERAREIALEWLRQAYTRIVEVPANEGDLYAYTERRRVAPRDDQLRITPRGLFLRPVWRLSGPGGSVDVDAMTGMALASEMRSYPDAVLLE